jgi:hypothetical protein
MLQLDQLAVGEVSGIIAAGIVVIQFILNLAFPLILVGLLNTNTGITTSAASWSVFSRSIHSSHWPTILSTDSSGNAATKKSISRIEWLSLLAVLLSGAASIATPLGLYQDIVAVDTTQPAFHYVRDNSPFGRGTPKRSSMPWSGVCNWVHHLICRNLNGSDCYFQCNNEDIGAHALPESVRLYESGLSNMSNSISSLFDIEYRFYMMAGYSYGSTAAHPVVHKHPIGQFRVISNLILEDRPLLVEGLIVDMLGGGVGFRNHSVPPLQSYASAWEEDILFLEPETHCVDTNLTIDTDANGLYLTDRGGLVHLKSSESIWFKKNEQKDLTLQERAFVAAHQTNLNTMLFLNVSSRSSDDEARFDSIDSYVGKTYSLLLRDGSTLIRDRQAVHLGTYGDHVRQYFERPGASIYSNPNNVSWDDFVSIGMSFGS